jgi:hypothetical protein
MAKCLVYKHKAASDKSENSIRVNNPNPDFVAFLMRDNGSSDLSGVDWEVAKTLQETDSDTASFQSDWRAFLASKLGTPRELVIRRFEEAKVTGGLTETEALTVIMERDCREFCECVGIMEDSDLPSDRYFRDAWEWSD